MRVTVPAAKAALIAQLQARTELDGVAVHWGLRPAVPAERERMYVLGAKDLSREAPYQADVTTETYELRILIEAHLAEKDLQVVEQRMWELYEELERAVDDDPELGGAVERATVAGAEEDEAGTATDQGWIVRVVARINVKARV